MSWNHFVCRLTGLARQGGVVWLCWLAPAAVFAQTPDYQWTFNSSGFLDYTLTSVSSPDVFAGPVPADDPTLHLQAGKRYRLTNVNFLVHPFEVLAKGASVAGDVVLLSEGSTVGSFESDSGVAWNDDSAGHLEFTVTENLYNAMIQSGRTPGYRCSIHASTMRGDFSVYGGGSPIADPIAARITKGNIRIDLETVMEGLTAPLGIVVPDDEPRRMFVYEQAGKVWLLLDGVAQTTPFLDLSDRLTTLGISGPGSFDERGLIGFALHPNYTADIPMARARVYTYTSEPPGGVADFTTSPPLPGSPNNHAVFAQWTASATNVNVVDPSTRRELLRIDDPQFNHNGGTMRFGPDGYLYIAIGDGGRADDQGDGHPPAGNGQNKNTIFGKILRIDPDGNNSANGRYGIPAGNPFVGADGLDEIYAYGFRNPFMFSFDRATSDLYVADVGQNDIEEVDRVTAGGNYGWRLKEGSFYFDANGTSPGFVTAVPAAPIPPGLIDPIAQYDHDEGISIIGGFVYRGSAIPSLQGLYVTGDFSTGFSRPAGRLFYLDLSSGLFSELQIGNFDPPLGHYLKGFGQDASGEIHAMLSEAIGPFGATGKVVKIVPADSPSSEDRFVALLEGSQAGTTATAGGTGRFTINTGANILEYEIRYGGDIGGAETAAHVHGPAAPGVNAAVKHPLPAGPVKTGVWNYSEADEIDILSGRMYVNVHSVAFPAGAIRGQIVNLVAKLDGPQAGTTSTASGTGHFILNTNENTLSYFITYGDLQSTQTAAHIHGFGTHTQNRPVRHPLPLDNPKIGTWTYPSGDENAILRGLTYANIHSTVAPAGEIRGQITRFVTTVDGPQVPTTSTAIGTGLFSLDPDNNVLGYHVTFGGLSAPETASHIHGPADPGQNAGVLHPLPAGSPKLGVWDYTPDQESVIAPSRTYVNVHSSNFPAGEIRGQVWIGAQGVLAAGHWMLYR